MTKIWSEKLDALSAINSSEIMSDSEKHPNDQNFRFEKLNCRIVIITLCDSYLLMLPKLMGCSLCQLMHNFANSTRSAHVAKREQQIRQLKKMLDHEDYHPREVLQHIEDNMCPFKGEFGKDFYHQCKWLLETLIYYPGD